MSIEIVVGDQVFELIKKGRAQADQVIGLGKWLSKHGQDISNALTSRGEDVGVDAGIEFIGSLLESVSSDALIELYQILIGCDSEFAEENFDVFVLVDSSQKLYENHDNLRKLVDRFFSTSKLENLETEESSIPSE